MVIFVSQEDAAARKAICDVCPSKSGILCGECGCIITAKIRVNTSNCPLNKWGNAPEVLDQPWDVEALKSGETK